MTTIQNKQQNLKSQIKPKDLGKSQRRIEDAVERVDGFEFRLHEKISKEN